VKNELLRQIPKVDRFLKDPELLELLDEKPTFFLKKAVNDVLSEVRSKILSGQELQLSYAIGVAEPLSISIETFGTGKIDDVVLERLVREHFDLRPGAIIRDLDLLRPIYRQTAAYGHFGRTDIDLPWERTDKAEELREAASVMTDAEFAFAS